MSQKSGYTSYLGKALLVTTDATNGTYFWLAKYVFSQRNYQRISKVGKETYEKSAKSLQKSWQENKPLVKKKIIEGLQKM